MNSDAIYKIKEDDMYIHIMYREKESIDWLYHFMKFSDWMIVERLSERSAEILKTKKKNVLSLYVYCLSMIFVVRTEGSAMNRCN